LHVDQVLDGPRDHELFRCRRVDGGTLERLERAHDVGQLAPHARLVRPR
jgi:hypothetical protein